MRWLRRITTAAALGLVFAESDSDSDSGDSDSGDSDSGDFGTSLGESASVFSSGDGTGTTAGGSSGESSNDSTSDSSTGGGTPPDGTGRKPGTPGITSVLQERDLTDIPFQGDSPIKKD